MPETKRIAWLPYASVEEAERRLGGIPDGIQVDVYRADGDSWPDSIADVEFYVLPYLKGEEVLDRVAEMKRLKVIQTLTAGVENFLPHVPEGVVLCNAAGVHDTSTAELAVALALASGRHLDHYARNQSSGIWESLRLGISLADQRVLIIGYGHIGAAIERRLSGFEVASVTRVARRPRTEPVPVHAIDDLPELLPDADVAFLVAPHTPQTEGMIGGPGTRFAARWSRAGQRRARQARRHRGAAGRDLDRPDPCSPGRHRSGTAASRASAVAYAGRTDLTPRGRAQQRLLPTRRPTHRGSVGPLRRRQGTGEHHHMTPLETPETEAFDADCIFCKIISGELPSRRIYEDERAVAFLDIGAWHRGHALVVPKRHVPDMLTGPGTLPEIAPAIDAVARLLTQRLAADGINVLSSSGEAAGQEVFHLHVHVVPRYADEPGLGMLVNSGVAPDGELDSVYSQIQAGA